MQKKAEAQHTKQNKQPSHPRRGLALALVVIPLGIAAWVILWQFGFIASVVSWGIAAGAVWLYKVGSAQDITRTVAPYLLAIILLGVVLAFLGGMISDAWIAYNTKEIGGTGSIMSSDFMTFLGDNLLNIELLQSYTVDILISLAFTALGTAGVIRSLYTKKSDEKTKAY